MQRKHYTEEEKNAVMSQYAACGGEVKALLAELGIPKSTFNQWLREYDLRYGCESKYDFSPRNFRNILQRNDHLEDLLAVLNESFVILPRVPRPFCAFFCKHIETSTFLFN